MAESAQGVVLVGAGRPVEGLSILERLRREVIEASYLVQLTTIEIPCGIAMVLSGNYAGGVADLENTIARFSRWRNKRMLAWGHLALGEVYLSLATAGKLPAVEGAAAECELLCARHSVGPTPRAAASRRGGAPCPRGRHARSAGARSCRSRTVEQVSRDSSSPHENSSNKRARSRRSLAPRS